MKKAQMRENIESFIKKVKDPRRKQGVRYPFSALVTMMLLGVASGHSGYRPLSRFMEANLTFFEKHFFLKYGVPTYGMLRDLIEGINKQEIVHLFNEWSAQTIKIEPGEWVSGDGKLLISTITDVHNSKQDFVSMVSLYAQDLGLCLFIQDYQSKKKSEIHVLEAMLDHLKGKEVTITLDALHCQKKQ